MLYSHRYFTCFAFLIHSCAAADNKTLNTTTHETCPGLATTKKRTCEHISEKWVSLFLQAQRGGNTSEDKSLVPASLKKKKRMCQSLEENIPSFCFVAHSFELIHLQLYACPWTTVTDGCEEIVLNRPLPPPPPSLSVGNIWIFCLSEVFHLSRIFSLNWLSAAVASVSILLFEAAYALLVKCLCAHSACLAHFFCLRRRVAYCFRDV